MKKLLLLLGLSGGLVFYFSCTKDHTYIVPVSGCNSTVTYHLRVANILNTYCANTNTGTSCHAQGSYNVGPHLGVPVQLYDSATAAAIFSNKNYNAICYIYVTGVGSQCTAPMPDLGVGVTLPDSLQTVPADTVNVLQCWIQNNCD